MNELEFMEEDTRQKIVTMFEKYGQDKFYLSFSGGRDSTILSAFIDICVPGNQIPRVFCDTGIELRMIRDFVLEKQKTDPRVEIIRPQKNIREILETYGYPFKSKYHSQRVSFYQNWLKKGGAGTRKAVDFYLDRSKISQWKCPERLLYQFTPDFHLKISSQCCYHLKETPLHKYQQTTGRARIVALCNEEGGQRTLGDQCFVLSGDTVKAFYPFRLVTNAFLDYLCDKYHIKLCDLYYPPYNRKRTGCKGCPFNPNLQKDLDVMQQFFPTERTQCEIIWKPVYDEYRRIGLRLKKNDNLQFILPLGSSKKEKE